MKRAATILWKVSAMVPSGLVGAHLREEDHIADRGLIGQEHDQAIDADPLPRRRRHAVLERAAEVLVVVHGLVVARALGLDLLGEARPLIERIVELGKS